MRNLVRRGAFALGMLFSTFSGGLQAQAICANPGSSGSGSISGVVNEYFQGNGNLAAGATTLTLGARDTRGTSDAVAVGDLLLIIQMQDATINSSNANTYGDGTGSGQGTTGVGNTGLHEFVRVVSTTGAGAGATVTFAPALTNAYTQAAPTATAGQKRYQVVRVPQYSSATAAGVTAPAWGFSNGATGETGGVVVIDVQGALTLGSATVEGQANRAIFVAGKGFRGGAGYQSTASSPATAWASVSIGPHGGKGEGIAGSPRYMASKVNGWGVRTTNPVAAAADLTRVDYSAEGYPGAGAHARGAPGNAGGGGTDGGGNGANNSENAGGGGGGGYAQGGLGGRPWNAPLVDTDGRGGAGYGGTLAFNRLFLGGGGGAGGTNDATTDAGTYVNQGVSCAGVAALCSSGAAGGGIVIVRARSINGTGLIDARGANGYNVGNDAAGGGGGGGGIVLYTIDGGNATLDMSGGDGGNAWASNSDTSPANRHGPGGGGGGGFAAFSPASLNITATATGGAPGRTTNGNGDTYSSSGFAGGLSTFQTPSTPGVAPGATCFTDLRLDKNDGTDTLVSGGTTTYALTVTNVGNSASSGTVTVVDVLPATLAVANGSVPLSGAQAASWACSAAANVLTCTSSAVINGGGSSTFAFTANVTGAGGTAAYNRARVGGANDPNKPAPTAATAGACVGTDNPLGCAIDADTINAPLLSVTKSDGTDEVRTGATTTYALQVRNSGTASTSGTIQVVDVLPTGMSYTGTTPFVSGGFSCTYTAASRSFVCTSSAPLAAGASATISIPAAIAATAGSGLTNRARVGGGGDPGKTTLPTVASTTACPVPQAPDTTASDTSSGCASDTDVARHVILTMNKDDGQPYMAINGQTTYQITVTNSGDADSSGTVFFRDVLPAPMNWPATLTVGGPNAAAWSCTRVSATEASCSTASVIAAGAQSQFSLVANVGAATSGVLYLNQARIGGGGDPTLVANPSAGDVTACTSENNPTGCSLDLDTAQSAAQVRLVKTHANPQARAPGDSVPFTLTVSNSGGIATGGTGTVRVIDVLPAGLTFAGTTPFDSGVFHCVVSAQTITCDNTNTPFAIAPNSSVGITFNATIAAIATNPLTNAAQVGTTGADPQNNTLPTAATAAACIAQDVPSLGCSADTVPLNADLSVVKSERIGTTAAFGPGPLTVANGNVVQFRIAVANAGPTRVTNAAVIDAVPADFTGLSLVSATAAGGATGCTTAAFTVAANTLSGTIASLPAGASCTLVLQAIASTNDTGVVNTAEVDAPAGINDANPANNTSSTTTNILPLPTLQAEKISIGGTGTFAFAGTNGYGADTIATTVAGTPVFGATRTLTAASTATVLTESAPPAGFVLTAASCSGLGSGGTATVDLVNRTISLDAAATAPGATIVCAFTNTKQPRISLQKALPGGRAQANDQFTLTIAGNGGPASVTTTGAGTAVTSAPALLVGVAGSTYTLSEAANPGNLANYASTIACTNAATGSATVLPSGSGTSFTLTPQAADDIACTWSNAAQVADLAITKTDGATTYVPGAPIAYTITASNAGPVAVIGATVTDTPPAAITGATWTCIGAGGGTCAASGAGAINTSVNLPVNASVTFTLSGTISAAATGDLANTATIAPPAGFVDPTPANNSATDTDTRVSRADIQVVKNGPASIALGGALTYSIVVSNNGPDAAGGTAFTDAVPAAIGGVTAICGAPTNGASCGPVNVAGNTVTSTIAALPANASVTFTISGTAPASGTSLNNSASASPPAGFVDPVPGNNASSVTTTLLQPLLTVSKAATPSPFVVGQPASYTITVSNIGAGPTAGTLTITDALPAGITLAGATGANWTCAGTTVLTCSFTGTIAAGASSVLTLNVDVLASAVNANNTATASGGGDAGCPAASRCTSSVTVPVNPSADIAVAKSIDDAAPNVGDDVTFTVTATNNGPSDATGVVVTDALPNGLQFVSATPSQGAYDAGTGAWSAGSIVIGANATLQITATVLAPGALTNTATRSGGDQFDPNAANNAGSASLNAQPSADLQVSKTASTTTPNLGTQVSFTITVHNAGPNDASGVVIDDALPAGLDFVSATASIGAYNPASGLWTLGLLANGADATLTIVASVSLPGDLTNTASVAASDQHDPNPANNSGGVTVNGQSADIQVLKGVDNANPVRGDTVTFTITATNNGPSAATGVAITDALPAGLGFVSASASQGTYVASTGVWTVGNLAATGTGATATLTIVASVDTDAGFTNTATLTAIDQTDPVPSNNTGSVPVTPVASADLSVVKTGPANATAGGQVTYTLVVSNAGPSDAANVSLDDPAPAGLTFVSADAPCAGGFPCDLGTLASGDSTTVTVTFAVASSATASITNIATVASDTADPEAANDSSTITTPLLRSADLAVVKNGPATVVANAPVSYSVIVSNLGPSDADGAAFSDPVPAALTGVTATCGAPTGGAVCGTVNVAGNSVTSTITTLPAGASVTFTIAGTAPADAAAFTNTASIAPPAGVTDPVAANDTGSASTTVAAAANVGVVKTGPASAVAGQTVTYTLTVHNAGPSAATNVSLADPAPPSLTFVSAAAPCAGGFPCNLGTLASGADVVVNATFAVAPNAAGTITNTATVASDTPDPTPGDNTGSAATTIAAVADLAAVKTGPATIAAGGTISYSVVVSNAGPSTATNASFTDNVPAGITQVAATCGAPSAGAACGPVSVAGNAVTSTITTLPLGGSVTFTVTGTAPAEPTTLSNTAQVTPPAGVADPVPGNNGSSANTNVGASANLGIVKSGPASVASGGALTYTLAITNAGPSAANGATYSDNVPAGITNVAASCSGASGGAVCATPTVAGNAVSGNVPTLPAGGAVTITITGNAPFGAQTLTNTASVAPPAGVNDPVSANNASSASTTLGAAADIALVKSVEDAAANVGENVTFTIVATNQGPNDATGVAATDSLPFGFAFVSATPSQGAYDESSGVWTIGNLADGASASLTIVATLTQPGALVNTVAVSASDQPDPDTSNNNAGAAVNAGASADIAVAKSVDTVSPNVGSTITYTVVASNQGPNGATGVEITDHLPAGVTLVAATPSQGSFDAGSGVWAIGALANGASATLTVTATVDAAGAILNSAAVTHADQFDPVGANNQAGATINGQEADLAVTKTVDDTAPNVGDTVNFTIGVLNNGPSDATNVAVTDALPNGLAFVAATPSQGSYDAATGVWTVGTLTAGGATSSATLTITATVQAAVALTNTASVSASDQTDPNSGNNSASASLNGNPLADLGVVKSGPATVTLGSNVVYSVVVTNAGPSDAANVVVSDPTPAGLAFVGNAGACTGAYPCALGTLASGASATITSTYAVPANYAGNPLIVNTASVASDTPDPNLGNNQGSAKTGVGDGIADLAIIKTGPATVTAGGAIAYTLTITNAGPSPANGATYSDVVPAAITAVTASCGGESGGAACVTQPTVAGNTVSGSVGSLPSGGNVVVTIAGTAPATPTTLANTATIAPPAGIDDPDPANDSSTVATTVAQTSADLTVIKSGPASASPGGNVTYTLTVSNAGPDTAANVVLDDPAPAGLTFVTASAPCTAGLPCALGDIAAGGSAIVTVTFAIDANANGPIVNTAGVGSDTPDPNPGNDTGVATTPLVPNTPSADLSVIKTGPGTAAPRANVTYTLLVANAGPDAATNVVLADPTPPGLAFVSATAPCASGFPCNLGTLASGANATIDVTYTVDADAIGTIVNQASVGSDVPDPNGGNNTGSAPTVIAIATTFADLSVVKSGPSSAAAGGNVTYTLLVANAGPDAATNVMLDDPTPAGLAFVSASAPCGAGFPCALGTLANGASTLVSVTFAIAPGATGSIVNNATVGSDASDPNVGNNASTVTTPLAASATSADLSVSKTGPASVVVGGTIAYTIVVSNAGPDAAANVIVTDPTPAGLAFVGNAGACTSAYPCALGTLASGASATITSTYAVPGDYAGANPIVNSVAVASDTPDPDGSANVGSATTPVTLPLGSADLEVTKSGPARATPGSTVVYTLTVVNRGPSDVFDAVLSDPTPAGLTFVSASGVCAGGFPCALGTLVNGAGATITATYAVDAGFTGQVANTASVSSPTVTDPTPANNAGSATTTVGGQGTASLPVPVDARWMLVLMGVLLMVATAPAIRRRR